MKAPTPHYLLFSETGCESDPGRWRFVIRAAGSLDEFEASDREPETRGERLELLTVVRALESLDQPSRVTLMTPGNYVRHGVRFGLPEWRNSGWEWEYFGQMTPIKHCDLWQRLDRLLAFHQVDFCRYRTDAAHAGVAPPRATTGRALAPHAVMRMVVFLRRQTRRRLDAAVRWWRRHLAERSRPGPAIAYEQGSLS